MEKGCGEMLWSEAVEERCGVRLQRKVAEGGRIRGGSE